MPCVEKFFIVCRTIDSISFTRSFNLVFLSCESVLCNPLYVLVFQYQAFEEHPNVSNSPLKPVANLFNFSWVNCEKGQTQFLFPEIFNLNHKTHFSLKFDLGLEVSITENRTFKYCRTKPFFFLNWLLPSFTYSLRRDFYKPNTFFKQPKLSRCLIYSEHLFPFNLVFSSLEQINLLSSYYDGRKKHKDIAEY